MGLSAGAVTLLGQIKQGSDAALQSHRGGGIPVQVLRELYTQSGDDFDVQYFLAGYSETPSRILEEMCASIEAATILALLAENPRTPKPALQQLARHERTEVRRAVASGKGISPQAALILCEDPNPFVRALLAENPAITPRVQVKLSEDPVPFVRSSLLKISKLDEEIQYALCDDRDVTVQAKALWHNRISEGCLLRWADGDEGLSQRMLLVRNQLPEKVLESLLFSTDPDVQLSAVSRKRLTEDEMVGLARSGDEGVRMKLAGFETLSSLVQGILADDESLAVRCELARNACVRVEAVERLIIHNEPELDVALAENGHVSMELLRPVIERCGVDVLRHVCMRPDLSSQDAVLLAQSMDESVLYQLWYRGVCLSGLPAGTLRSLVHHVMPSVRELAARASGLTIAMMSDLSKDASPLVRLALASNEETLPSFLEVLATDSDSRVASKSRSSLARQASEALAVSLAGDGAPSSSDESSVEESGEAASSDAAETGGDGPSEGGGGLLKRFRSIFGGR